MAEIKAFRYLTDKNRQVYPASFLSTGAGSKPGWGDIKGITSKLDYLKHLGGKYNIRVIDVDDLWLTDTKWMSYGSRRVSESGYDAFHAVTY